MNVLDERPQLGTLAVDSAVLAGEGLELEAILTELEIHLTGQIPADTPRVGWRVLTSRNGVVETIGAPTDDDAQWWRLGRVVGTRGPTPQLLELHSASQRRRPSDKERAKGLSLQWPSITRSSPDLNLLAIDIVNTGEERWHPQGDSFMVFAALRQPGGPPPGVNFAYVSGQYPALPLDPGEYARVRVVVDYGQWTDLVPGPYEVHAILVNLGLHGSEPLQIQLTEQDLQDHRPRRTPPPPPPL
jgi:hypothetical protein